MKKKKKYTTSTSSFDEFNTTSSNDRKDFSSPEINRSSSFTLNINNNYTTNSIDKVFRCMKLAVHIWLKVKKKIINKYVNDIDVMHIKKIISCESRSLNIDLDISKLNVYPIVLEFNRIATFGNNMLIATLPNEQLKLMESLHRILFTILAVMDIPISITDAEINRSASISEIEMGYIIEQNESIIKKFHDVISFKKILESHLT